ncbi:MAG: InlB B-repeat-containing protein, partial [Firmicutes bacterium]|nr:InlB B-repeat-containing protein [Bacillota bacterium]
TVIVLPSSFTAPAGFVFTGWNTAADGSGTAYAPGATFVLDGNATLYAQYAETAVVVYTVTFDSQGGSKVNPVEAADNSTITEPAAPVREGYIFGGWYKEKECKNAWDFASNVVTEDMTLYAKWTPKKDLPATAGGSTASIPPLAVVFLIGGLLILHRCRKVYA